MKIADLNEDKVAEVLAYLATTDADYAAAKAQLESTEILRKRVRARAFIESEGTVAERQAEAEVADDVQASDDAYLKALAEFEKLRAHRKRGVSGRAFKAEDSSKKRS